MSPDWSISDHFKAVIYYLQDILDIQKFHILRLGTYMRDTTG